MIFYPTEFTPFAHNKELKHGMLLTAMRYYEQLPEGVVGRNWKFLIEIAISDNGIKLITDAIKEDELLKFSVKGQYKDDELYNETPELKLILKDKEVVIPNEDWLSLWSWKTNRI